MNSKLWMMVVLCFLSHSVMAKNKVIYGVDNRLDVYETQETRFVDWSKSTAGMFAKSSITQTGETFSVNGATLEKRGICSGARFAQQMTGALCSGFLIAPDVLVTAGHCVQGAGDCASHSWIFDYANTDGEKTSFTFTKEQVYNCSAVLSQKLSSMSGDDYAVIKLDRPVLGRTPLKVRLTGKIAVGEPVVVIGHPTGLPTKIAPGAKVRKSEHDKYFVANLDTFAGNSGSAVFNETTGVIEGILVRGETDYVMDSTGKCKMPYMCAENACRGEDVTRINSIPNLGSYIK